VATAVDLICQCIAGGSPVDLDNPGPLVLDVFGHPFPGERLVLGNI
jgi:hypothetical protein